MNMNFDLAKILDKAFDDFKKTTPLLVSICLVSFLLLFLPAPFKKIIRLDGLSEKALTVIGIIFIVSASLIIVIVVFKLFEYIKRIIYIKHLEKCMLLLPERAKMIILVMFHSNDNLISLEENDGIKGVLLAKNIIYRASNVSDGVGVISFQYALQPWVIEYCMKHKEFDSVPLEEIKHFKDKHYQKLSMIFTY